MRRRAPTSSRGPAESCDGCSLHRASSCCMVVSRASRSIKLFFSRRLCFLFWLFVFAGGINYVAAARGGRSGEGAARSSWKRRRLHVTRWQTKRANFLWVVDRAIWEEEGKRQTDRQARNGKKISRSHRYFRGPNRYIDACVFSCSFLKVLCCKPGIALHAHWTSPLSAVTNTNIVVRSRTRPAHASNNPF